MITEETIQLLVKLSQGNPGAALVLSQLAKFNNIEEIHKLERAGVKGSGFWILYKDICKQDIPVLINLVKTAPEAELLRLSKE